MSILSFIKDYIYEIYNFYDSITGQIDLISAIKFTFFYFVQSIKFLLQYIITLQWITDFTAFKIIIYNFVESDFINNALSFKTPAISFFNFFEPPQFKNNLFLLGIINSLFFALPFTSNHLLWLRRTTVEGWFPGFISALGIILGQTFLIACILFGFRFVIFPWFSLESFNSIFGAILTLNIIIKILERPIRRVRKYETERLKKAFFLHFILAWAEQTTLFQYISSLSIGPEPSLFETINSSESIFPQIQYLIGVFGGMVLWTLCFGGLILYLGDIIPKIFKFSYSLWVIYFHKCSIVLLIAINIANFGNYNIDYLWTSPIGFTSQDTALTGYQLKTNVKDIKKGKLGDYSRRTSVDTEVALFDRNRYSSLADLELTFEDLNYQAEYAWRTRNDRLSANSQGVVNKWIARFLPDKTARLRKKFLSQPPSTGEPDRSEYGPIGGPFVGQKIYRNTFIERFLDDHHADVVDEEFNDPYGSTDEEPYSAFMEILNYGFDPLPNLDYPSDEFEYRLGLRIKERHYLNPIYRNILRLDWESFFGGQPKKYFLTEADENELFRKRLILARYYDSLRKYSRLIYSSDFKELFNGPKSYANRVYNQQFKGTLKIIKRLFPLTLDEVDNPKQSSILKFDQPLYKDKKEKNNPLLHEELIKIAKKKSSRIKKIKKDKGAFIKQTNPTPLYAGWDTKTRKFVVTNYKFMNLETNYEINYSNIFQDSWLEYLKYPIINLVDSKKPKKLKFITWPICEERLEDLKSKKTRPEVLMFTSFTDPANEEQMDIFEYPEIEGFEPQLVFEILPMNVRRVDLPERYKVSAILHPTRGGFVWSGSDAKPVNEILSKYDNKIKEIWINKTKGYWKSIRSKFKNPIKKMISDMSNKKKRDWRDSNP